MAPPNTRLQRTPLCVERDRAFFSVSFCYNGVAINRGGAAKAQPVGRQAITVVCKKASEFTAAVSGSYTDCRKGTPTMKLSHEFRFVSLLLIILLIALFLGSTLGTWLLQVLPDNVIAAIAQNQISITLICIALVAMMVMVFSRRTRH